MTSATRPESEAHRSGTTTSRAPRWLAIRRGLDRQGLPAVSRACPGPKPRPTPLGRRTHGPSDPVASLHAAVQRPPLESSSTPFVIGPPSPAWLPGDDGSIKTPAGVPCHANGGDTAGSRGAFRCPGTRPGCNSRRTARVHPEVNMNRASFRPHRSPTLTGGTPRASGGATRPWVTPWSTPFPLRPAQLLRPGCPPVDVPRTSTSSYEPGTESWQAKRAFRNEEYYPQAAPCRRLRHPPRLSPDRPQAALLRRDPRLARPARSGAREGRWRAL